MEKPASLKEKKKRIFSEIFFLVCGIATILKVKSIAFRCSFFFLVRLAHLKISEPFHLKAFFFLRKFIILISQGCTGLVRSAVVYILLYGFIYFFTVQISWKIFFPGVSLDFFIFFFFFGPSVYLLSF